MMALATHKSLENQRPSLVRDGRLLLSGLVTFDGPAHIWRDCGTDCGTPECRTHAHHCAPERTDAHIRLSDSDLRLTAANGKRFKSPLLYQLSYRL